MRTVKYCDSVYSAHLICGRLANEGIEAKVINENLGSVIPYTFAIESLKIQVVVADEYVAKAIETLHYSTENSNKIECPYCGSIDIGFRFPSHKRINKVTKYLFLVLALLTVSPMGNIQKVNYCKSCKQEFSDN